MLTVADLMIRAVFAVDEADTAQHAKEVMAQRRIRHLPVLRGRKLVGLVTERDVTRGMGRPWPARTPLGVEDIMTQPVRTVSPETPARQALQLMTANKWGCLPVVDGEHHLVGIVTDSDFVALADRQMADQEQQELAFTQPYDEAT